jgi:amidase
VHLPVAAVPVGRAPDGLPVGVQVVGPYLEDRTVVDVAVRISAVVGGFASPPGYL